VDVESFLNGDYQLKVRYLTDHLQRTWTRFNFFITIESGLVTGLAFTSGRTGGFTDSALYFLIAEAAVSVVWWVFGAQDRHHVVVYRKQIEQAWKLLASRPPLATELPRDYAHAGTMEGRTAKVRPGLLQWRWDLVSTTRLPALVPLLLLATWLSLIVVYLATR
jgi:hypothetical protein